MSNAPDNRPATVGLTFARDLARIADENRAEDIVLMDLRGISPVTDFFVLATGTSDRQLRAIADQIDDYAHTLGQRRFGISGYETATWILVDYVDVVVHLFNAEKRRFYDLELLWGDAARVDWRSMP